MRTILTVVCSVAVALGVAWLTGAWDEPTTAAKPRPQLIQPNNDARPERASGSTPHDIYERTAPGVVFVSTRVVTQESLLEAPTEERGQGSGFVIDESGYILTNEHVVEGARDVRVSFGERSLPASVVGADASTDLALLRVDPERVDLEPLELGDSDGVEVGDPALAIGNPYGLDRTLTTGVISALKRPIQSPNGFRIDDALQTDAAVNPGNSGGPLLDGEGRVVGINSQILTGGSGSKGNVGIGFAVPINLAKSLIGRLKRGDVQRPYLGVSGISIGPQLRGLDAGLPRRGVLLAGVRSGSPAERAGLRGGSRTANDPNGNQLVLGGDVITRIGRTEIRSMEQLSGVVDGLRVGDRVEIEYLRAGDRERVDVTVAARPSDRVDAAGP